MQTFDVVTNVFSNFVFVFLVALLLWLANLLLRFGRLGKAHRFFGLRPEFPLRIYVSGFPVSL